VSKLNSRIPGVGGFLNVFPNAKVRVHCGGFTAGKSDIEVKDGKLKIRKDGEIIKFLNKVDQITLNGDYILGHSTPTIVITERAVFDLTREGLVLKEIAPGVDLQKDVLDKMEFKPTVSPNLKLMPAEIFDEHMLMLKDRDPWKTFSLY
jgi:propionate CoA-transferase